ncbi:hypothetical protein N7499_009062 [Penicillium canescens]|uniref:Uncharacterized protein n=1 Tax=Penicillium canescens TaxID=5083 RepID=A0AAD6NGH3_PENCN|nr:uncharacterized protein N7446_008914 [Penicillium canescens]KAJ6032793.1 hypothetical protein N7444_010564 [Penicillium canescens]KAJ6058015.1 hypothetical protein N7460_001289 [Penicillium canescens]KAJ6059331.1 hypothetical protein N7446_008914 [Penicillium canescens]KAJ6071048.1 hypothetical protein N7499_009062 [Penicillium canescens]KAJ6169732.1 hypothetical protein N7485_007078 [Penicillium canescens]
MTLGPHVEKLLQWIDKATAHGIIPQFQGHQSNLRPDILLPVTDHEIPEFRVCEINDRLPISFLHYVATAYEALSGSTWNTPLIEPATKYNVLLESLFDLFDPDGPVHFAKGFPSNNPLFGFIEERTGRRPRTVRLGDLRIVHSPTIKTPPGSNLEVDGEMLEPVHQVGLQLYDFELFSLSREMCDTLPRAAGITPGIKDQYILKPTGDARGAGILLGRNISIEQWQSTLTSLDSQDIYSAATQYMLQPLLDLRSFEWFWDEERQVRKSCSVGTYYSVKGRFVGLGMWRTGAVSEDVISASTKDATSALAMVALTS